MALSATVEKYCEVRIPEDDHVTFQIKVCLVLFSSLSLPLFVFVFVIAVVVVVVIVILIVFLFAVLYLS